MAAQSVRNTVMSIDDRQGAGLPSHAGFGPVLNVGHLHAVAFVWTPLTARAGALFAGITLALMVLALPGGAIALTVAQINPSLTARHAPSFHMGATTTTTDAAQNTVTDPRR